MPGSRQFKDFEDYLLPTAAFEALLGSDSLPLVIQTVNLLALRLQWFEATPAHASSRAILQVTECFSLAQSTANARCLFRCSELFMVCFCCLWFLRRFAWLRGAASLGHE